MKKKGFVILSILMAAAALVVLMLVTAGANRAAAQGGDEPVFALIKETGNPTVTVGEVFTVTLVVSPTSLTSEMTQTLPITITDPNLAYPVYLEFLSTTVKATAGTAYYTNTLDHPLSVIWKTTVISTSPVQTATFQVLVKSSGDLTETKMFTNYAYMEVGDYPGSLPGSLPGTLPGSVPGSVPFSVPADSRVVWDNFTISPMPVGVTLFPAASIKVSPGAIATHMLTITNTGSVSNTFIFTYTGNTWGMAGQQPVYLSAPSVTLDAGLSASVVVTVGILPVATKNMSDTLVFTATAQSGVASAFSLLTTSTGCRFDFDYTNRVTAADVTQVANVWNTELGDFAYVRFYDFDHNNRVTAADVTQAANQWNVTCP